MGILDFFRSLVGRNDPRPDTEANRQVTTFVERRRQPRINARSGVRVLIIDDSRTITFALRRMLDSVGITTMHASDAETGLELARKEQLDLIFLDIILPGMNGFAALRALRHDARTRRIPVIMMSSNEKAAELFHRSHIDADDFMKKPFSRLDVFSRIEHLLDEDRVPRRRVTPSAGVKGAAAGAQA